MKHSRILVLKETARKGNSVVYVMSREQRVRDNFALLAAQERALELQLPLIVVFNLMPAVKPRAYEHVSFMLQGLSDVERQLKALSIPFIITHQPDALALSDWLTSLNPASIYFDFSPLNGPRLTAKKVADSTGVSCYVVDSHNIIPAWRASDHQEFAAHTFRRKVHKLLAEYLEEPDDVVHHPYSLKSLPDSLPRAEIDAVLDSYPKRGISLDFKPGEPEALAHLDAFVRTRFSSYALQRNDMTTDMQSGLSPYLHFGHIASLRVALSVMRAAGKTPLLFEQPKMAAPDSGSGLVDGMNALFEEMIVRKELSDNFCLYAKDYRSLDGAPAWALDTLSEHRGDVREFTYSYDDLEQAKTHDEIWNAAQKQLTSSGKIHGYMRMYWAKKILEWSIEPETAHANALLLNDSYSIDGGDPNGYVGVLWSIAGLHDRPWTERPIFGKIRYMNAAGLQRKFDIKAYVAAQTTQTLL